MPYGTVNADVIQSSVSGVSLGAGNASIMKNRIINGAMVIDQRNAGASVALGAGGPGYFLDRWAYYIPNNSSGTLQQVSDAPAGFVNSLKFTAGTGVAVNTQNEVYQTIEGYNIADLGFGTASAKTFTISFWVKSSLTGTFNVSCTINTQSYVSTYSIPVANTWTQCFVTIAGNTTTSPISTTNGVGLVVFFSLGQSATYQTTANTWTTGDYKGTSGATSVVATTGATWQVTGVQLEVGSSATGFEYRQYTTELTLCQRYYFTAGGSIRMYTDTTGAYCSTVPPVTPRATPTITLPTPGTGAGILVVGANGTNGVYTLIKTGSGTSFANADGYTMAGSAEL